MPSSRRSSDGFAGLQKLLLPADRNIKNIICGLTLFCFVRRLVCGTSRMLFN